MGNTVHIICADSYTLSRRKCPSKVPVRVFFAKGVSTGRSLCFFPLHPLSLVRFKFNYIRVLVTDFLQATLTKSQVVIFPENENGPPVLRSCFNPYLPPRKPAQQRRMKFSTGRVSSPPHHSVRFRSTKKSIITKNGPSPPITVVRPMLGTLQNI